MLPIIDNNIVTRDYTYVRNHDHMARPLEEKLAKIYGADRVLITSSGMDASTLVLDYLLPKGGKIIIDENAYYEMRQWLSYVGRYDVETMDLHHFNVKEGRTRFEGAQLIYLDNPNVFGGIYDVQTISAIAHKAGALVCVDNTILSLYYMNPLRDGADKYVCGYGDMMAGGIALTKAVNRAQDYGFAQVDIDWVAGKRGKHVPAETIYGIERGLETLAVRLERHTKTAKNLSNRLRMAGVKVWYAGKGGVLILPHKTEKLCDELRVFKKYPTFGVTYATTSYVRSDKMYEHVGNFVRLYVGLEDEERLAADIAQALDLDKI